MDARLYEKIRKKAKLLYGRKHFWEDLANAVAANWIRRGDAAHGQTIQQALSDAYRELYGRKGSQRFAANQSFESSSKFDSKTSDGRSFEESFIPERRDPDEFEFSRLDTDLIGAGNEFQHRDNVTESRNSQLRKVYNKEIVKKYLWNHFKEYGVESDIEVDWITL